MPFPKNPVDLQVYVAGNNYFVFKSGKGWTRLESDVFFKQSTQPTLQDLKGRNSVWQDTSTNTFSFWNAASGWITTNNACSPKILNTPKSMVFYSDPYDKLISETVPEITSGRRAINARNITSYNVKINGPSPYPSITEINYFVMFLDPYGNPIDLPTIPDIKVSWSAKNGNPIGPLLSAVVSKASEDPAWDMYEKYIYLVKVKIDTSSYGYKFSYDDYYAENLPSSLIIDFSESSYGLTISNVIPSAHYEFRVLTGPNETFKNETISPKLRPVMYPQFHQVQKNKKKLDVPIVIKATTGFTNTFDSFGDFIGVTNPVPYDGIPNTTHQSFSGHNVVATIKSVLNVSGTPTYSLTGTTTKTAVNGTVVFDDLGIDINNFFLINGLTPSVLITFSSPDTIFLSKTIEINWI